MLTLHRLPRSYRALYVGVAVLLAAAIGTHWLRLGLRHGVTPGAVAAWYRGDTAAMLFPKASIEVADDAWMNLFHHTLAFLVLGGLLVRTGARPGVKAGLAVLFGAGTLASAAGPPLVWWGVPGAATLYVGTLATLSALGVAALVLVVRDAVVRRGAGHRGTLGTDVLAPAIAFTAILLGASLPPRLSAQTMLTERQAIGKVFPGARYVATDSLRLDRAARAALEATLGRPLYEPAYPVRRLYGAAGGDGGGGPAARPLGYTLVTEERGKYRPITMLIGVDTAQRVAGVQILVYREPRGGEVAREYFLRQYRGKSVGDPIRLNRDIINISGATISVHSVNAGVRKTLALIAHFYRDAIPPAPPLSSLIPLEDLP
ncbi:MAG: FMN-binding protein [Gemmatimonadales bacterium]